MIDTMSRLNSAVDFGANYNFDQSQNIKTAGAIAENENHNSVTSQFANSISRNLQSVELDAENEENKNKKITKEEVSQITEQLNELADKMNVNIKFKYYEKLDRLTTQIIEKKTNKVLKEFPPQEMIKVLTKIHDWIGIMLDKKI